jgi:hypothetical protein
MDDLRFVQAVHGSAGYWRSCTACRCEGEGLIGLLLVHVHTQVDLASVRLSRLWYNLIYLSRKYEYRTGWPCVIHLFLL